MMKSFQNLKIVTRLFVGFAAVIVLLLTLGAVALVEVSAEDTHVKNLRDNWMPSVHTSLEMLGALRGIRIAEWGAVAAQTADDDASSDKILVGAIAAFSKATQAYEALPSNDDAKAAFAHVKSLIPQYIQYDQQVRELA